MDTMQQLPGVVSPGNSDVYQLAVGLLLAAKLLEDSSLVRCDTVLVVTAYTMKMEVEISCEKPVTVYQSIRRKEG